MEANDLPWTIVKSSVHNEVDPHLAHAQIVAGLRCDPAESFIMGNTSHARVNLGLEGMRVVVSVGLILGL